MGDELKNRALRLLARREHSRAELRARLSAQAQDPAELERLLDEFEARGWISEQRVLEQILRARQGRYGTSRIAHELRQKGIPEELAAEALALIRQAEPGVARALREKRFGALPKSAAERAKQARFLRNRGFSEETIRRVLNEKDD